MCEKTILKCCVSNGLFIYQAKKFCSEGRISAKLFKFVFHPVLVSWTYTKYESSQALSKQHMSSFGLACVIKKKVHLSFTDDVLVRYWRRFFQTTKNHIQSLVKIVWEMNWEIVWDEFTYKNRFRHQKLCLRPQFWCWKWNFLTDFSWKIWAKNTKINFS